HLRISSPPYRHPCHLGMDTGRRAELLAARLSVPEIREHIGADSLGYLSVRGLLQAMGRTKATTCLACLDGDYPLPVQMEKVKLAIALGRHDTIGQDLVHHCIDDILTVGARPLFFLDYLGIGRLVPETVAQIVRGLAGACRRHGAALIGGETAEMPDLYAPG